MVHLVSLIKGNICEIIWGRIWKSLGSPADYSACPIPVRVRGKQAGSLAGSKERKQCSEESLGRSLEGPHVKVVCQGQTWRSNSASVSHWLTAACETWGLQANLAIDLHKWRLGCLQPKFWETHSHGCQQCWGKLFVTAEQKLCSGKCIHFQLFLFLLFSVYLHWYDLIIFLFKNSNPTSPGFFPREKDAFHAKSGKLEPQCLYGQRSQGRAGTEGEDSGDEESGAIERGGPCP